MTVEIIQAIGTYIIWPLIFGALLVTYVWGLVK